MTLKRSICLLFIVGTLVAMPVGAKPGKGGAAQKATGSISIFEKWDGGYREVSLNAHEAKANRPAKGQMVDMVYGPDGNLRRVFEYEVKYVRVDGDVAHIGALCTLDSADALTGNWLYVKVEDGGTPGRKGDGIGWKWGSESNVESWVDNGSSTGWWRIAIDGNLQVHSN